MLLRDTSLHLLRTLRTHKAKNDFKNDIVNKIDTKLFETSFKRALAVAGRPQTYGRTNGRALLWQRFLNIGLSFLINHLTGLTRLQ